MYGGGGAMFWVSLLPLGVDCEWAMNSALDQILFKSDMQK